MTIAQLHYLTAAHLGDQPNATGTRRSREPEPTGDLRDLLTFDRLQG